jgi:hypothetical protein
MKCCLQIAYWMRPGYQVILLPADQTVFVADPRLGNRVALRSGAFNVVAAQITDSSIRRKRDDHSPLVMNEPLSFDAMVPRHEIYAGPTQSIALMME